MKLIIRRIAITTIPEPNKIHAKSAVKTLSKGIRFDWRSKYSRFVYMWTVFEFSLHVECIQFE